MLCHRAVKELFLEQLRVIDSHPYENVGCDGRPLAENSETITPDYETIFIKVCFPWCEYADGVSPVS